jgi:alpha-beta hydrolase superfamily lysophospholipase
MAGTFRLAFRRFIPWSARLHDQRWALSALDTHVLCGRMIASDGAELPYRYWPARGVAQAALLMLHGACDYSGAFDEVGPKRARRGFCVLADDNPGLGGTRRRGHWAGKKRMAKDVAETLIMLRGRTGDIPIFVAGESMGGAMAVQAAVRENIAVDGLVLAAPGALASTFWRLIASWLARLINYFAPEWEIVIERLSGKDLTPAAALHLLFDPMILRGIRPEMLFGLVKLARSSVEKADKVTLPVLTMMGSRDDILRQACIWALHQRLAGKKEWALLDGGPHLLFHWQRHDLVLDRMAHWMKQRIAARPRPTVAGIARRPSIAQSAAAERAANA